MRLATPRLLLDQPRDGDLPDIVASCRDPLFERFMTLPWPYAPEDARFFVDTLIPRGWETGEEATWALRRADDPRPLLGVVGLRRENHDIGYWLGGPHRGRGYMTEAVVRVISWALDAHFFGTPEVRWSCVSGNVASASVARKAGFRFLGSGPSPVPMRDGSRPAAWLGVHVPDDPAAESSWPAETRSGPPRAGGSG